MTEFTRRCVVSVRKLYLLESIRAGQKPKWGDVFALTELVASGYVVDDPTKPLRLTEEGEALLDWAISEHTKTNEEGRS